MYSSYSTEHADATIWHATQRLGAIEVNGHYDNHVGTSDAASEGQRSMAADFAANLRVNF